LGRESSSQKNKEDYQSYAVEGYCH
jgi:hypothetical protein